MVAPEIINRDIEMKRRAVLPSPRKPGPGRRPSQVYQERPQ